MNDETKLKIDIEIIKLKAEPKITMKFKQNLQNKNYMVSIEKPKNLFVSVFLAEQIFNNELIKKPYMINGRSGYYDKETLKLIKVLNIEEIEKQKSIFKRF